jgi:hypothetical protein
MPRLFHGTLAALCCVALHMIGPEAARAQEAPAASTVPLEALKDRVITITMKDGRQVTGQLLSVQDDEVVLALRPDQRVQAFSQGDVADVRLARTSATAPPAPAPVAEVVQPAPPPPRPRHAALNLSLAPGFNIDVDYSYFHGFLNASLVLPMASTGELLAFSAGLGAGLPVAPRLPSLKLDLFALVAPVRFGSDARVGFGVGLGLHHTWSNGLTMGFKVPILGYSATIVRGSKYSPTEGGLGVAMFYLCSVMGMPIGYLGYRF